MIAPSANPAPASRNLEICGSPALPKHHFNTDTVSSNLPFRQYPFAKSNPPKKAKQSKAEQEKQKAGIKRKLTFRTNDQTPPLLRPSIDGLDNINQLLLILQHPVQLVVVTRPKITHHMLVAKEEHQCHRVVQLVHLFEVRHLVEVADVHDGEVLDSVCYSCGGVLVEDG